jgi:GT2 family glycosyltransferase
VPEVETTADVALVVVCFRSSADLGRLLDTVPAAVAGLRCEVVVVDNDPHGDPELERVLATHPRVRLVRAGANLGYSGGINLGLRSVRGARGVCVANPDIELAPGSLATLLKVAEAYGAAAPRLVDSHGNTLRSIRREPSVLGAWGEALLGDHLAGRPPRLTEMVRDDDAYETPRHVDWATGAVLMTSRAAVESVGGWDDRFFLYSEETDYCRRLRAAGFAVRYEPGALATHHEGGSGRSPSLTALVAVNRVRYFRRVHGGVRHAFFTAAVATQHALRARHPGERAALKALLSQRARRKLPGEARFA